MKHLPLPYRLAIVSVVLFLAACAKREDAGQMERMGAVAASPATPAAAQQMLAYEHQATIETAPEQVAAVYQTGISTCHAAANAACVVLDSRLSTGEHASASLKVRVKHGWRQALLQAMGTQGEISQQSTTVEDLAVPIGDTRKKLDMLTSYRTKLETLQGKAAADIDAAMKIAKELTQVQSDIEALSGEQAYLLQRVNMEVLTVSIESNAAGTFAGPIKDAVSNFGNTLSQGIASAIMGTAYLLPWALVLGLLTWLGRKLWQKLKAKSKP